MMERWTVRNVKFNTIGFAKALGISQPTYFRYETGGQKLSAKLIKGLILKFNININWLFTGEGSMFVKNHSGKLQKPPRANLYCINEKIKFLIKKNKINTINNSNKNENKYRKRDMCPVLKVRHMSL